MSLTLLDLCIKRIQALSPRNQHHLADRWDMVSAMQEHRLLADGTQDEKAAAAGNTPMEVYETIAAFLDESARQAAEETAVTSYYLDPALYNKLVYMAKHGLSLKAGEMIT